MHITGRYAVRLATSLASYDSTIQPATGAPHRERDPHFCIIDVAMTLGTVERSRRFRDH